MDNEFDYLLPEGTSAEVGSIVRVDLHGRRVRGWVTAVDVEPPVGLALRTVSKVSGLGPDRELQDLAAWASKRWTGSRSIYLTTASPPRNVATLVLRSSSRHESTWSAGVHLRRVGPATDPFDKIEEAARQGPALVLVPSQRQQVATARRLRRLGIDTAIYPDDWARAASGGVTVVGTRSAAWARMPELTAIVMVDIHDESYWSEAAPTWNAFDVCVERARMRNIAMLGVSSVPRVVQIHAGVLEAPDRSEERSAWAPLHVVDVRKSDPSKGLYSAALVELLRSDKRVVCVLNRKGRARLLVCAACDAVASCDQCNGAEMLVDEVLECRRCATQRGVFCAVCGSTRLKQLRQGVTKVADELARLALREVAEVSSDSTELPDAAVLVGTEAVLHRIGKADAIAFLEFDQELLAERYKAEEDALVLLARASRLVGGHRRNGVVVVQTRQPEHLVLRAAAAGNPALFSDHEDARRRELGWPPYSVLARLSGPRAGDAARSMPASVDAFGPDESGKWMLRAPDHATVTETLSGFKRKGRDLRVEIDPARA